MGREQFKVHLLLFNSIQTGKLVVNYSKSERYDQAVGTLFEFNWLLEILIVQVGSMRRDKRTKGFVHRFGIREMLFYIRIEHYCSLFLSEIVHLN